MHRIDNLHYTALCWPCDRSWPSAAPIETESQNQTWRYLLNLQLTGRPYLSRLVEGSL